MTLLARMAPTLRVCACIIALGSACGPGRIAGQNLAVGDLFEEYLRVLQVAGQARTGSFTVRPQLREDGTGWEVTGNHDPWRVASRLGARDSLSASVWVGGVQAATHGYVNSSFALTQNDGAVWQGKGLTAAISAGGTVGFGALTVTVRPLAVFVQNGGFPLAATGSPDPPASTGTHGRPTSIFLSASALKRSGRSIRGSRPPASPFAGSVWDSAPRISGGVPALKTP